MENEMKLKNKVVVVTGAASGIGKAITHLFLREGANVIAGDWNKDKLDLLLSELEQFDGNLVGVSGDISKRVDSEALIEAAVKEFGSIDILINNAGVMDYMAGVGEVDDDTWDKMLAVNTTGPMFTTRKAVQYMLKKGSGTIINIASTAAIHGAIAGVAYTTSKHALIGFTKNTAWTYALKGIRCNAICPGATKTDIQDSVLGGTTSPLGLERFSPVHKLSPAFLEAIDIAQIAFFLSTDEARMINGAIVAADGGWGAI